MNKQMTNALSKGDNTPVVLIGADGQAIETICSTEVAVMIEMRHDNVIAKIKGYEEVLQNDPTLKLRTAEYFIKSTYVDSNNQQRPCYKVTKKGCEMIANKLTGQKGILFTAKYIERFHEMENYIVEKKEEYEGLSTEMKALMMLDKRSVEQDKRISRLEDNIHISRLQKKQLREFISTVVVNACGSKYSKAFKEFGKKAYSAAYHDLYNAFGVSSYEEIPKIKFQDALAFINRWTPNRELELLIKGSNAEVLNE